MQLPGKNLLARFSISLHHLVDHSLSFVASVFQIQLYASPLSTFFVHIFHILDRIGSQIDLSGNHSDYPECLQILTVTSFLIYIFNWMMLTFDLCSCIATSKLQRSAYSTSHKWHRQGATKQLILLNKYLLMVTFEYSENNSITFEMSNHGPLLDIRFDSKWKKRYLYL